MTTDSPDKQILGADTSAAETLSGQTGEGGFVTPPTDSSNALVEPSLRGAGKRGRPAGFTRKTGRPFDVSRKQGKRKRVKAKLTQADKLGILQLYAVYKNKAEVARQLDYGYKTVVDVIDQFNSRDPVKTAEIIRRVDDELSLKLVDKTNKILDGITDDKIERASLAQLSVGAGILVDKKINLQKQYVAEGTQGNTEFASLSSQSLQDLLLTLKNRVARAEWLRLDFAGTDSLQANGQRIAEEVAKVERAVEAEVYDMDGNVVSTR